MKIARSNRLLLIELAVALLIAVAPTNAAFGLPHRGKATIVNRGTHYRVTLALGHKAGHREMGRSYGRALQEQVPEFESIIDSYIAEITQNDLMYGAFLARAAAIKPQVPSQYVEEVEGLAEIIDDNRAADLRGDGQLSRNELIMYNLIPDVARGTACSYAAVYGVRSATRRTILARMLDYYGGMQNQLPRLQAITEIKNQPQNQTITLISYLGYLGVISGFNNKTRIFAAILDSPTGASYDATGKRSYPMDLRLVLETGRCLEHVSWFMSDPTKSYTYNHLIALADPRESAVLENNISGTGTDIRREPRYSDSVLHDGITWGITNAVGSVNSFLLAGNTDNHNTNLENTARWEVLKAQLLAKGNVVTVQELKEVLSFDNGDGPGLRTTGDLYNARTQQIILLEPASLDLEVFFRPVTGLPADPVFERIDL